MEGDVDVPIGLNEGMDIDQFVEVRYGYREP